MILPDGAFFIAQISGNLTTKSLGTDKGLKAKRTSAKECLRHNSQKGGSDYFSVASTLAKEQVERTCLFVKEEE